MELLVYASSSKKCSYRVPTNWWGPQQASGSFHSELNDIYQKCRSINTSTVAEVYLQFIVYWQLNCWRVIGTSSSTTCEPGESLILIDLQVDGFGNSDTCSLVIHISPILNSHIC